MTDQSTVAMPDVAHCTIADIGLKLSGSEASRFIKAIDGYLSVFAKPSKRVRWNGLDGTIACLNCDAQLDGPCGSFQWHPIVAGEGNCVRCGWPTRGQHVPALDGEAIFDRPLNTLLQYHPNNVGIRKRDEADD